MRLSELRRREPLDQILWATLARHWTEEFGRSVTVCKPTATDAQVWFEHRLLSVFHARAPDSDVRAFMADLYRYTPARRRALIQWAATSVAGTRFGARAMSKASFVAAPGVPGCERLLIVPGNERIRVFDFDRQRVRVTVKEGYSTARTASELALRAQPAVQWPEVLCQAEDASWFEEPLLFGYTLPRCPPWYPRARLRADAIELLQKLHDQTSARVDAYSYADQAAQSAIAPPPIHDTLVAMVGDLGEVELTLGHGDFQLGNVFVHRRDRSVTIIDWEYAERRQRAFDGYVLLLDSRHPKGLAERLLHFVEHGAKDYALIGQEARSRSWRRASGALFLLEEAAWQAARAATSSPAWKDPYGEALAREVQAATERLRVL